MNSQEPKRIPLYTKIRAYILEQIRLNEWGADDQLPTEAVLAERFDVSRFTVKKALADLVEEGLVYRVQGKGTFIAPTAAAAELPRAENTELVSPALRPIAFIVPSVKGTLAARILAGVEAELADRGYQVFYRATANDADRERQLIRECLSLGVKGIVIMPADGESYNEELLKLSFKQFPVVVIDRYLREIETNCVCSDHFGGAYSAVSKLVEIGHTEIGFLSVYPKNVSSLEERFRGYEQALADHRIPIDRQRCLIEIGEKPQEEAAKELRTMLRDFLASNRELTAVVSATLPSGLELMAAAEEMDIAIPEQLSVFFFDDYEYAELARIPPSCIVQNERQIGTEAARLLLSIMENPAQERKRILVPTRLELRQSTAARNRVQS